jgi:hypothetical protein
MAFNPTLPADHAPIVADELRNQFTALKALIDAQQAQISALQGQLSQAAKNPNVGEFDPGFSDPPTIQDLQGIQNFLNQMNAGMNW